MFISGDTHRVEYLEWDVQDKKAGKLATSMYEPDLQVNNKLHNVHSN